MSEYHKIQTVYKRDPETRHKTLLEGEFSIPEFEYLQDCEWVWTEKIDGTNIRVQLSGDFVRFAGKTDAAQIPPALLDRLREMFPVSKLQDSFSDGMILYGEGFGAKIQKGGGDYVPDGCSFVLFDVRVGDWWLTRDSVEEVAKSLGILVAPEIGRGPLLDAVEMAREGFESRVALRPKQAEGLVMRPAVELFSRNGERVIAKIKSKDFA